jgi:hypothetical protein
MLKIKKFNIFKKKSLLSTVCFLLLFGLIACQNDKQEDQTTVAEIAPKIMVKVQLERLDSSLFATQNATSLQLFFKQNAFLLKTYFPENQFGKSPKVEKTLGGLLQSKDLRAFHQQSTSLYNFKEIETQFSEAFSSIKAQYPNFTPPKVCTMFSGFMGNDLYVSDTLIVIGLDYFAGKKARFRPQVYDYQLRKYEPSYVVPQVLVLLSAKYNETNLKDESLLAEMIYYGKSYEFVSQLLPTLPDSLVIGYSQEQLDETENAQDLVWGHFIDEQLLYKTDHFTKAKYVGEAPSTPAVGPKCPGSIGRWVGWKIVRKYIENNPATTIPTLMKNTEVQKILEGSKYRGVVE